MLKYVLIILMFLFTKAMALESKTLGHLISLPLIEGGGAYSSIRLLRYDDNNLKVSAITNLSLLGVNAGLGAYTLWKGKENYTLLRKIHRITGCLVCAASLWSTISSVTSSKVDKKDKLVSGVYTTLTVVPIIVFSF